MIRKISKCEHIGKFYNFFPRKNFQFEENNNCNIIFGSNGSGKTTFQM